MEVEDAGFYSDNDNESFVHDNKTVVMTNEAIALSQQNVQLLRPVHQPSVNYNYVE